MKIVEEVRFNWKDILNFLYDEGELGKQILNFFYSADKDYKNDPASVSFVYEYLRDAKAFKN